MTYPSMKSFLLISLSLLSFAFLKAQEQQWATYYEQSGFLSTPRYDATIDYCKALADASDIVHYTTFGISPQGRDLPLLIIDSDGYTDAATIHSSGKSLLLVEACIHPGESEGKDAGLMLIRDMAIYQKHAELLDKVSLLFIPIFNVDGHERFGKYNRINQNGPDEMGWRVTAKNLNLNRDFIKADAPEMQDWLKMFNQWLPDFFIDCHTTDGADYQYVATYSLEIFGNMDKGLTHWLENNYIPEMEEDMFSKGFPVFPYVSFRKWHDPRSGLYRSAAPPMISQGYMALQNRPGLLIETHMLKPYKPRVESTFELIRFTMETMNNQHEQLQNLIREADLYAASADFRAQPFVVDFKTNMKDSVMVDFLGVEYDIVKSELTNGPWFQYHPEKPKTYRLPLFAEATAKNTVLLPDAYIIPPQWEDVIERLQCHGISISRLEKDKEIEVETYRFYEPKWQNKSFEGRHALTTKAEKIKKVVVYPKGSAVIDMNQRSARIIAHILEPMARDSYVYWGFFDPVFEQKEYAETYVMEPLAREMLKNNDSLRMAFEKVKGTFGENQRAMLNWFYQQSPYWDDQINLYPVGRIFKKSSN